MRKKNENDRLRQNTIQSPLVGSPFYFFVYYVENFLPQQGVPLQPKHNGGGHAEQRKKAVVCEPL
jgi:hypothetical protein